MFILQKTYQFQVVEFQNCIFRNWAYVASKRPIFTAFLQLFLDQNILGASANSGLGGGGWFI